MKVKGRYYCDICLSLHITAGFNMTSYENTEKLFQHVKAAHPQAIIDFHRITKAQLQLAKLEE